MVSCILTGVWFDGVWCELSEPVCRSINGGLWLYNVLSGQQLVGGPPGRVLM